MSVKLVFLILGTKEEKIHLPHLKVKGEEACRPVCLPASQKRGAEAKWIRREGRGKSTQTNKTNIKIGQK